MTYALDHAQIATPIGMVLIKGDDGRIAGIATELPALGSTGNTTLRKGTPWPA